MKTLVAGDTGLVEGHTCVELVEIGNEAVIIDNLYDSQADVVDKIENITGKRVTFHEANRCGEATLGKIFSEHKIDTTIHFAGYKAVGESVQRPTMYYQNNLMSLLVLCKVMREYNCRCIVSSLNVTIYENPASIPIFEDSLLGPITNPYGITELIIEQVLKDLYISDNEWNIALLCYFNPTGAHKSGLLGESPNDIPNNLMPYIVRVVNRELPYLYVYGNDYDTPDGTGMRDYTHVVDLAKGYVNTVNKVMGPIGVDAYNLGIGIRYSVLDVVNTFTKVNNIEVPYQTDPKRPRDITQHYASTGRALKKLGWKAERGLGEVCVDT